MLCAVQGNSIFVQFITMQCMMVLCSSFQCNARWFCAVTALLFITIQNDGLVGQVLHDRVSRGVTQPLFIYLQFGYSSIYKSGLIVIIYYQKWPFIIHLYKRGGLPAFIHALTIRIFISSVNNSWLIVIPYYQKWSSIIYLYQGRGHPAFIHPLTIQIFAARFAFWSEWNVLDWIRASFGVAAPRFIIRT